MATLSWDTVRQQGTPLSIFWDWENQPDLTHKAQDIRKFFASKGGPFRSLFHNSFILAIIKNFIAAANGFKLSPSDRSTLYSAGVTVVDVPDGGGRINDAVDIHLITEIAKVTSDGPSFINSLACVSPSTTTYYGVTHF